MKQICLQKSPKISHKFNCNICDLSTSKLRDFDKHLLTAKHQKNTQKTHFETNETHLSPKISQKTIACQKCFSTFNSRSTLWRHLKKCNNTKQNKNSNENNTNDMSKLTELVMDVVKQNNELTKQIIELSSKSTITNNNTTNNSFNLQFFLNETCKDALNITDFVNQLQVGIKDLEETGRLGYAEGISKIFINGLKQLDVSQRPVHCSDIKRETMYIKDSDKWTKDDNENIVLTNAIKDVAHKNIKQIPIWTQANPEHKDITSKCNDKYMKLVSEAMSGTTMEESDKNYKKIVKNIMKESVIDK